MQRSDGVDARTQTVASRSAKKRKRLRTILMLSVLTFLILVLVGFQSDFVPSESMEPNLKPGDHLLTLRSWLAYPAGALPARGDIVVFRMPSSVLDAASIRKPAVGRNNVGATATVSAPSETLIKRVVALPGERVKVEADRVLVNGVPIPENYSIIKSDVDTMQACTYGCQTELLVPDGQVFVLGDNRNNSDDGRFWGTLKRELIVGRYMFKLYNEGASGINTLRHQ